MAVLDAKARKALKKSQFAIPEKAPGSGSYPINDEGHARAALARVKQFGTPEEQARVRRAVARKFPEMELEGKEKKGEKREEKKEEKRGRSEREERRGRRSK